MTLSNRDTITNAQKQFISQWLYISDQNSQIGWLWYSPDISASNQLYKKQISRFCRLSALGQIGSKRHTWSISFKYLSILFIIIAYHTQREGGRKERARVQGEGGGNKKKGESFASRKKKHRAKDGRCMPEISAHRITRQYYYCEFQANQGYWVSLKAACVAEWDPIFKLTLVKHTYKTPEEKTITSAKFSAYHMQAICVPVEKKNI